MAATQRAVRVLKQVSGPHAFNIGMNLGGVAGGSLAEHLHQHVVPRWSGDANFITVSAAPRPCPQLLERHARAARATPGPEVSGVGRHPVRVLGGAALEAPGSPG